MDQISDQQLFEELGTSTEGLSAVSNAASGKDFSAAKSAIVEHLKARRYPAASPLEEQQDQRGHGQSGDEDIIGEADRIVDHVFEFVGHPPQQLGREISWNEDPVDYEQWPISFNRHFHWITLAKAYAASGDEKYAVEFVAQLKSHIRFLLLIQVFIGFICFVYWCLYNIILYYRFYIGVYRFYICF